MLRLVLYYQHGPSAPEDSLLGLEQPAWPAQVARNLAAVLLVLLVLVGVTLWSHGANLEAPADASVSDYPARPEWYFLALFQMLNHFESPYEVIGTHILPGILFLFFFSLPLLDRILPGRVVYGSACAVLGLVLGGALVLMTEAVLADRSNVSFQLARRDADNQRERALQLARTSGVPPDGAVYLLRRDPLTHGRAVLEQRCLSCHYYQGQGQETRQIITVSPSARNDPKVQPVQVAELPEPAARALAASLPKFTPRGPARLDQTEGHALGGYIVEGTNAQGDPVTLIVSPDGRTIQSTVMSRQLASDLSGFGSRDWVRGLLADPSSPRYFGTTPQLNGMKTWKKGSTLTDEQLDKVADFVAELGDVAPGEGYFEWFERRYVGDLEEHPGHDLFVKDCGACHFVGLPDYSITEGGDMEAPNLFGYGSDAWVTKMINHPDADDLYSYLPETDRMPAFDGRLSENDLTTLVRFLKGDYVAPSSTEAAAAGTRIAEAPDVKVTEKPVASSPEDKSTGGDGGAK